MPAFAPVLSPEDAWRVGSWGRYGTACRLATADFGRRKGPVYLILKPGDIEYSAVERAGVHRVSFRDELKVADFLVS